MLTPEEQDRADVYALLSALLLSPDALLVQALGSLPRSEAGSELAGRWNDMLEMAARRGVAGVREEYELLFVAPGTPRIIPCQCYYVAGWPMDKPLARLRQDLQHLGLARTLRATELEDHLGALCEAMRILVLGHPAATQQAFFDEHLADWSTDCLADIAAVPGADFYRALATFAQAFFAQEAHAFALDEAAVIHRIDLGVGAKAPDAAGHRP